MTIKKIQEITGPISLGLPIKRDYSILGRCIIGMMRGQREWREPGLMMGLRQQATCDRQSYNGVWRACWLLFTRLSLASDDPPGSLIRQNAVADRPLSIGRHFVRPRTRRRHHFRRTYRVAHAPTHKSAATPELQKLTTSAGSRGRQSHCTLLTASVAFFYQSSADWSSKFDIDEIWSRREPLITGRTYRATHRRRRHSLLGRGYM